jgi:hypothetical protein
MNSISARARSNGSGDERSPRNMDEAQLMRSLIQNNSTKSRLSIQVATGDSLRVADHSPENDPNGFLPNRTL